MARSRLVAALFLLLALAGCARDAGDGQDVAPPTTAATATAGAVPTAAAPTPMATLAPSPPPTSGFPAASGSPAAPTRPALPTVAAVATAPPATTAPAAPVATAIVTVAPTRRPATATATPRPTTAAPAATPPPAPTPTAPRSAATVPAAALPPARAVDRGPATRRLIALTFDAGADRGYAARILDTLRDTGVKATFGMTGKWAEQNPDLVQRMVAEGHLLMNHTYDHASFTGRSPGTAPLTAEQRRREIERTEAVIAALVGVDLKPYFRPPSGDYDQAMLAQLGQLGYTQSVMWTVDSLGWKGRSAEQIVRRCLDGAAPGAIFLFHVGADSQDAAALPALIRQLRAAGYAFATVAELLR